ncbi:unnamed protein product [Trifolium pratense]|uniref:Uncharacterized protein n=1 Tax=Trifolium pratense TaxID=57577 RepID=A0ACB0KTR4_TRIPR|nr:unnamed protein product [Trifolium pratense]
MAKKKKKSVHLPHEVITEILLRLPAKTLVRCRCVCKSWRSLISHDSHFAISHFQFTTTHKLFFIYYDVPKTLSIDFNASLYDDTAFSSSLRLRFLPPRGSRLQIGGSCRGFLFLHCHRSIYLWNPSTGIHRKIPIASNHNTSKLLLCGFAYDTIADDYLVVLGSYKYIVTLDPVYSPVNLEIFSLRANKWKQIEVAAYLPYRKTANSVEGPIVGFVLNGSIHWLVCNYETGENFITSFDLKEMRMSEIALPDDFCMELELYYSLSSIDYDLFEFCGHISAWKVEMQTIEIWVMQEYKVHSSWTKTVHFSYDPAPSFNPIYFTNCGDIVGTVGDGGLVKFNDKGVMLEYRSYGDCFFERSQMVVYTESLLSFPGGTTDQP